MRLMKLGTVAVLISASLLSACSDNGDDERRRPRIAAPDSLTTAIVGTPYTATFTSAGSTVTWSVTAGTLPPGIALDATSGQYSGTPTLAGTYSFTIAATNNLGMDSRDYSQLVSPPQPDSNALLSSNMLASFPAAVPAGLTTPVTITGLHPNDTLVSIDRRPQNGFLYGLGYNAVNGSVQLYAISSSTAVAAPVGTAGDFVAADGITRVRIGVDAATTFGMDFNPTVDRVRVVNSTGQNFRMNPNNGALVDGDAVGTGVNMDGGINGPTTSVQEAAYTNSAPNVTATTQYTLDQTIDALCIQNPPNVGTQTLCAPLSVPLETVQGFDIPPSVTVTTASAPATGLGTAIVRASGRTQDELININLSTGSVTTLGPLATPGIIGVALQQPAATPLLALSADGTQLLRFLLSSTTLSGPITVSIAGVLAGETLIGIDYRPQTGQLFSLGVNPDTDAATVYIIDPQTGAASVVGAGGSVAFVTTTGTVVDLPPIAAGYGFDFNPTVDRIRVVTGTGLNFRVNPNDGAPVDSNTAFAGSNPDGSINGQPAGSTGVTAAAYTNSFGQPLMGGVTTQYVIDPISNSLFIQNPPNNGTLTAAQPITLNGNALDFVEANGFDIPSTVRVTASASPATGSGLAALTVGTTTRLYSIDLSNGRATDLGALPAGVTGLTVGLTSLQ